MLIKIIKLRYVDLLAFTVLMVLQVSVYQLVKILGTLIILKYVIINFIKVNIIVVLICVLNILYKYVFLQFKENVARILFVHCIAITLTTLYFGKVMANHMLVVTYFVTSCCIILRIFGGERSIPPASKNAIESLEVKNVSILISGNVCVHDLPYIISIFLAFY